MGVSFNLPVETTRDRMAPVLGGNDSHVEKHPPWGSLSARCGIAPGVHQGGRENMGNAE